MMKDHDAADDMPVAEEDPTALRHDQLPSVEEIRMTAASQLTDTNRPAHSSRFPWIVAGVVFVVMSAIIIGLSVGLVKEEEEVASQGVQGRQESRLQEVQDFLVQEGITDAQDLGRDGYVEAVRWIADVDGMFLPIPASTTSPAGVVFVQRYVLALLYTTLNGENWDHQLKFLQPIDHCDWRDVFQFNDEGRVFYIGVSCDEAGHVKEIEIPGNNLKGTIPPEIRYLATLTKLSLNHNDLEGPIPEGFRSLLNLNYLALHYNNYSGAIPSWIGELTELKVLGLGVNALRFQIPSQISNLKKLVTLGLDHNALSGEVTVLNDLTELRRLYLEDNLLTGKIDASSLVNLLSLEDLDLSGNFFTGTVPAHFFVNSNMRVLDLGANKLKGQIPAVDSPNLLKYISLHYNELSGQIPATIALAKNATHLDLSGNKLAGFIPSEIASMKNLNYLFVANNKDFSQDSIPTWIGSMTNLIDLSLKNTNRKSSIPTELGKLSKLVLLDLDNNQLTGSIPSELGRLSMLNYLLLNRNFITNSIPAEFEQLSRLDMVMLDRTSITGTAEVICKRDKDPRVFTADCKAPSEIECDCCTLCCEDSTACHDQENLGMIDPTWEHSFAREYYEFSPTLIYQSEASNRRELASPSLKG